MLIINLPSGRAAVLTAVLLTGSGLTLQAFPPAPFHTLYGMVRDENGQAIRVEGAKVTFCKNTTPVLSETIQESSQLDQNYQIRLRMDMLRAGTQSYTDLANSTGTSFTLGIVLHDAVYYPIEMSSPHAIGKPGERVRLDLTLGVDSDLDGLPDAWEQSQLQAGGVSPGASGWDLSLLTRDGDFDGDGISNWNEYLAGTYAADPTQFLSLRLSAKFPDSVRLTFFSIYGKKYSLETSSDLATWAPASLYLSNPADDPGHPKEPEFPTDKFRPDAPPAAQASLLAADTALVNIYAAAGAGPVFYRLKVR